MLDWANKMTNAARIHVREALLYAKDRIADMQELDDNTLRDWAEFNSIECMSDKQIIEEVDHLLEAHQSKSTFIPTEYHWALLYAVLSDYFSPAEHRLESFCDRYFWDMDFQLPAQAINSLGTDQKKLSGISDGLFGVVNKLAPSKEDLVMKEVEPRHSR
ncbi:MAG: hypothetical protein ABFE07_28920 [Armatimonadia bacterium]